MQTGELRPELKERYTTDKPEPRSFSKNMNKNIFIPFIFSLALLQIEQAHWFLQSVAICWMCPYQKKASRDPSSRFAETRKMAISSSEISFACASTRNSLIVFMSRITCSLFRPRILLKQFQCFSMSFLRSENRIPDLFPSKSSP